MTVCASGSEWDGVGQDWYAWTNYDVQKYLDWAGLGSFKYLLSALTLPQLFKLSDFCTTERAYAGDLSLVDIGGVVNLDPVTGHPSINPLPGFDVIGKINANATWYLFATHCLCSAGAPVCGTLWGGSPPSWSQSAASNLQFGNRFTAVVSGNLSGGRYYSPSGGPQSIAFNLWDWLTGTLLDTSATYTPAASSTLPFTFPLNPAVVAGHDYVIGYRLGSSSSFKYTGTDFSTFSTATIHGVGCYGNAYGPGVMPNSRINPQSYAVEPELCVSGAAVAPTQPTPAVIPAVQSAAAPACASYADLCDRLHALEQQVIWTKSSIDLVQRQSVPFAYTPGASHAVTGDGSFAVQGILGLSVDLTTIPTYAGHVPGTPEAFFRLGWVSLGTAEGWERPVPLRTDPTLILGVSGAITKVGYSLPSGVAATVTELLTEF